MSENQGNPHPSVGRMVHFREHAGAEPVPGVVTRVWSDFPDPMINLVIFVDGVGTQPRTSVPFRQFDNEWGWSWPTRA